MYIKDNEHIVKDALYPESGLRFDVKAAEALSSTHASSSKPHFVVSGEYLMTEATLTKLSELATEAKLADEALKDNTKLASFLAEAVESGKLNSWEVIPLSGQFSNLKFRVNSGFQIDLSQLPRARYNQENKLNIYDLFVKGSDY